MSNWLRVIAFGLSVGGCAGSAHLYPVNDLAMSTGILDARFMPQGNGHGEIEVTLPDGELVKGQYSIVLIGSAGFGSVYGSVFMSGRSAVGSVESTSGSTAGESPGIASLFGDRGGSMLCEFYNHNSSRHGSGGCRSFTGALYRLEY